MKKPSSASLFFTFAAFVVVIFVCTIAIFMLNVQSTEPGAVTGSRSFLRSVTAANAGETDELYRLNDDYAFLVTEDDFVALVKYERSSYPLAFACGTYTDVGNTINYPLEQGDYFFSTYPNADNEYAVYNTLTNEYETVGALREYYDTFLEPETAAPVTPQAVRFAYAQLPLQKESCLTVTVAELLLVGLFASIGCICMVVAAKKAKEIQ